MKSFSWRESKVASKLNLVLAVLLAGFFAAGSVDAHHSRAAFNLDEKIAVEGEVSEVGWTNPHYYLSVTSTETGVPNQWTFEGHSIPGLVRNGWSKDSIRVGTRVRVVASPNRDPQIRFGLLDHVTRTDGKTFFSFKPTQDLAQRPRPPLQPSLDFSGTWRVERSLRANLVGGFKPPDWPLTEAARREVQAYDPRQDPSLHCQPRGIPRMLDWPYAQRWEVDDDGIYVTIEHSTDRRWFRTAKDADPAKVKAWSLHDVGSTVIERHTQDELVLSSSGFEPKFWGNARGISSGVGKNVREHYALIDGGYRLKLTFTVEDPEFLAGPVSKTLYFTKLHDFDFAEEPPCDLHTAQRHLEFE